MREEAKNPKGQGLETDHTLRTALPAYLIAKPWKVMVHCRVADALSRREVLTQILSSHRSLCCQIPPSSMRQNRSCIHVHRGLVCRGHTSVHTAV